jgi:hypothetical protein
MKEININSMYYNVYSFNKINLLQKRRKNAVFWDVAPCRYCVSRRFGGTYRLRLQGI